MSKHNLTINENKSKITWILGMLPYIDACWELNTTRYWFFKKKRCSHHFKMQQTTSKSWLANLKALLGNWSEHKISFYRSWFVKIPKPVPLFLGECCEKLSWVGLGKTSSADKEKYLEIAQVLVKSNIIFWRRVVRGWPKQIKCM